MNSTARAVVDWRRRLGYSGKGGLYQVQFDDFRELDHEQYSFRSLEAEVTQMIPLMRANWVIALHGLATVTDVDATEAVPYFMLPSLGGGKTLRGFPDLRFRDRHRLVMNAELRWTPARFLDMALFYDAGKVTAQKGDLNFRDLEDSVRDRHEDHRCERVRIQGRRRAQPGARRASSHQRGRRILMVSNASKIRQGLFAVGCVFAVAVTAGAVKNGQKFYPDDPIAQIVDAEDASGVQDRDIDLEYDTLENLFSWPGDQTPNVRAQNVNTIDEVPDSTWFTNRLGSVPVTVDELVTGPGAGNGPAPGGWTVIAAKNDGVMPGFRVRDAAGQVWFVKFDPPGYPAMATGTEVVVARLFWALGYNVPETHLATLRPEDLTIDDQARIASPSGKRRPFKESDIRLLLRKAHREADGSYRVVVSKALEGRPIGGFRFYGTRSDDPNDLDRP